jgi:hypothetical protein
MMGQDDVPTKFSAKKHKTIAEAPGTTWVNACQNSRLWKLARSLGVLGSQIWPCRGVNAVRKAWKPFRAICLNHTLEQ